MANIIVESYASAEAKGIKPVDSIISVAGGAVVFVKKKNPPYKIVGYGQGYTFHSGEVIFSRNLKKYYVISEDDETYTIKAVNPKVAKRIASFKFREGTYELFSSPKGRKI